MGGPDARLSGEEKNTGAAATDLQEDAGSAIRGDNLVTTERNRRASVACLVHTVIRTDALRRQRDLDQKAWCIWNSAPSFGAWFGIEREWRIAYAMWPVRSEGRATQTVFS